MNARRHDQHDLFISYTHLDNARFDTEQGWIDLLHQRLAVRLAQLLGDQAAIWRDRKLQGNDAFADTLLAEISKATLLLSVLSPRYLRSEWCLRELNSFYQHAEQSGGALMDVKSRVFKVLKTPIPLEAQPEELQRLLGYEFYELDQASNRFREFGDEAGANRDRRYWDKFEDLAQDLARLIEQLRTLDETAPSPLAPASGKTIYLAETTGDLGEARDGIKRDLLQHGHRVLPDRPLTLNQQLRHEVKNHLAICDLSIHLIGENYGIVPESEMRSIVELQHELALAQSAAPTFRHLLWLPPGLSSSDPRQQSFIDQLLNHSGFTKGTELLQTKLEDLKTIIHEKLETPPPAPASPLNHSSGKSAPALIYLTCDQPDYDAVAPIEEYLFQRGFEVISLAGEADPQMHKENLLMCDAVLTYCGQTTDGWLNLKKMDLLKLPGYGRTKPMLAKAFYLGAPQTQVRDRFRMQDGLVIRNYEDFSPDLLTAFLAQIEAATGGAQG